MSSSKPIKLVIPKVMKPDFVPRTIRDFNRYMGHIQSQLSTVKNNNINSLKCRKNNSKITFNESAEFNILDTSIELFYEDAITKYVKSFTSVFQNDNEDGVFENYYLKMHYADNIQIIITTILKSFNFPRRERQIEFSHRLFNEEFDATLQNLQKEVGARTFFNDDGDEVGIEDALEAYDYYVRILNKINAIAVTGKSVCMLNIVIGEPVPGDDDIIHIVALIFWYAESRLHCGIYDPLYFERPAKGNNMLWGADTSYITLKVAAAVAGIPIRIYNLSKYCATTPAEGNIHCVQYTINAFYCSMYSLYFLYLYAADGFPKDLKRIEAVVKKTFVVENPANLTRLTCKNQNIFKLVTMSFILTVLTIITNDIKILKTIRAIHTICLHQGYSLLAPEILSILNDAVPSSNFNNWYMPVNNTPLNNWSKPVAFSVIEGGNYKQKYTMRRKRPLNKKTRRR